MSLPVVLDRTKVQPKGTVMRLSIKPTRAGSATRGDAAGRDRSRRRAERWSTLPVVTAVNRIDAVKPGATVLLTGTDESRARAADADLPALRPRQDVRVPAAGFVDLADARVDPRRGS